MTRLQFPGPDADVPRPTQLSAPYWAGCARGVVLYQRCAACGRPADVPSWRCRWCGGADLSWRPSAGRGAIYSWSVVWRPRSPGLEVPYGVVIADMDEGFQLLSNLGDCDTEALSVGTRVQVVFRHLSDDVGLPLLVLEGSAAADVSVER